MGGVYETIARRGYRVIGGATGGLRKGGLLRKRAIIRECLSDLFSETLHNITSY